MSLFQADQISAGYGKNPVLTDVSFSMDEGCIMGILGANGSGKTTLIKAICGILPHQGSCILKSNTSETGSAEKGVQLETLSSREVAKHVSYIPQRSGLSIDIAVIDVVLMGFNPQLGLLEHPTRAMREAALQALAEVGLNGFENKNYLHLSEGQKQLCILARTMVAGSRLLLLDEPESALDFQHRYKMMEKIRSWVAAVRGGVGVTLHDPVLALNCCDQLLLLQEGKVLDILKPKEDELDKMEEKLSCIYGAVSLQWCFGRDGRKWLAMLKEEE